MKIAHIADCHLRQTQYGSRARGYDFYKGLLSAVKTAIVDVKVDAILCAGDMLDGPYPSAEIISEQLMTIHEMLKEHNVPMLVINGNHDNTRTPWSKVFHTGPAYEAKSGIIAIDGERYTVVGADGTEVDVLGHPYCTPDELRAHFEDLKNMGVTADIFMWHGEVLEFCGYPREGCIAMADFPDAMFQIVAMGDQHIHKHLKRDSDGLVVAYPGSTELCSTSEDAQKHMYVYEFLPTKAFTVESVPFKTRQVQKFRINTPEDLEYTFSEMAPGALIFAEYNVAVPGVMARLTSFVDTHPNTILRPTGLRDKGDEVEVFENIDATSVSSLQDFASATLSESNADTKIAKLVCQLTDPVVDSRAIIDQYVDNALN